MVISFVGCEKPKSMAEIRANIDHGAKLYCARQLTERNYNRLPYGCIIKEVHLTMDDRVLYCLVSPYDPKTQTVDFDIFYKAYPNGYNPEPAEYYTVKISDDKYSLILDNRIYIQRLEVKPQEDKAVANAN